MQMFIHTFKIVEVVICRKKYDKSNYLRPSFQGGYDTSHHSTIAHLKVKMDCFYSRFKQSEVNNHYYHTFLGNFSISALVILRCVKNT